MADVGRLRGNRWYRPGAGLHLPGFDADQVVPGQAWHGHRYGDHGLRRRRDGRCSAGCSADEPFLFADRSEEHTSELQSLMRISYAVFCLKKNTYKIL